MSKKRSQSQMILETIDAIDSKKSPLGDASPSDEDMLKLIAFLQNPENNGKPVEVQTRLLSIDSNIRREILIDESYEALKQSIAMYGLLQPIIIQLHLGKPTITAGHRRFKACLELGQQRIRAIARSEQDRTTIQIFENIHRSDLSPIEYCEAIKALKDVNPGWTISDLCNAIGQADRKTVGYYLKIADWPEDRKKHAIEHKFSKRQLIACEKAKAKEPPVGDASPMQPERIEAILNQMSITGVDRRALLKASKPILSLSRKQLDQLEAILKELKIQSSDQHEGDASPIIEPLTH